MKNAIAAVNLRTFENRTLMQIGACGLKGLGNVHSFESHCTDCRPICIEFRRIEITYVRLLSRRAFHHFDCITLRPATNTFTRHLTYADLSGYIRYNMKPYCSVEYAIWLRISAAKIFSLVIVGKQRSPRQTRPIAGDRSSRNTSV